MFDDAPVGTTLGVITGYDHNTGIAAHTALLSLTPCPPSRTSNSVANNTILVLPTNCTSGELESDNDMIVVLYQNSLCQMLEMRMDYFH